MCYKCGKPITQEQIARGDTCPTCHADLHVCRNCAFYSPGSHWDCSETVSEPCFDKERANFCDFFRVRRTRTKEREFSVSLCETENSLRSAMPNAAFDALFS